MQLNSEKRKAIIFNIQRFSIYDGPGIRTTVFLKGCNLRCQWCHNPESFLAMPEISFDSAKCIGCGRCFENCKFGGHRIDREGAHIHVQENCQNCLACVDECYARALSAIGKEYTPEELMEELADDFPYFKNCKSGGGITFSGGECMLQPDFLVDVSRACREQGISIAIDTAGNVPYSSFEKTNPYADYYLYDLKAYHPEVHRMATGVSNEMILENLILLLNDGKKVIVRIPVIPEINAKELPYIRDFLREHRVEKVELLAYHNMGIAKQHLLQGKRTPQREFTAPTKEQMEEYEKIFQEFD
jgi:glycyl-radical enzyme activating protein